jgi:hypothetical protein
VSSRTDIFTSEGQQSTTKYLSVSGNSPLVTLVIAMSFCKTVVVLQDRQKSMEAETKRLEEERKKDKEQSIQNKIKV